MWLAVGLVKCHDSAPSSATDMRLEHHLWQNRIRKWTRCRHHHHLSALFFTCNKHEPPWKWRGHDMFLSCDVVTCFRRSHILWAASQALSRMLFLHLNLYSICSAWNFIYTFCSMPVAHNAEITQKITSSAFDLPMWITGDVCEAADEREGLYYKNKITFLSAKRQYYREKSGC